MNLVGAFVPPEGDGDLLILLQVRKRLVEELVGDVDRLGIDDFLHSHRVGVRHAIGGCRCKHDVFHLIERVLYLFGHNRHSILLSRGSSRARTGAPRNL